MEQIGCGCSRRVYKLNDDTVIKIPYNQYGLTQAQEEYDTYQVKKYQPYLAEILNYDEDTGEIQMELLEDCGFLLKKDAIENNIFPDYILDLIDAQTVQVGKDKNGNIKIFDYGSEHVPSEVVRNYTKEQKDELKRYPLRKFKL